MLLQHLADTQNLINDASGQFFRIETLTNYVNRARRRIALASGCIRLMPQGAQTVANQEKYLFKDWMPMVQTEIPGARCIFAVHSVAVALAPGPGAWKPVWNRLPWTDFQARMRIWNRSWVGTISYPGYYAQYSFGTTGSLYLAPIPSMSQPMDVDCSCLPFDLQRDDDPEAIPEPWVDAVPFYAAFLCLMQQQRGQDAAGIYQMFSAELPFCAATVAPRMITSPYGAIVRSS